MTDSALLSKAENFYWLMSRNSIYQPQIQQSFSFSMSGNELLISGNFVEIKKDERYEIGDEWYFNQFFKIVACCMELKKQVT